MNPAFAVLMFTALAMFLAVALLTISYLLGPRRIRRAKLEPYECGVPIHEPARAPFHVHYYMVAVLFLLFDIELAFIIPWISVFKRLEWYGIATMGIFVIVLILGLVYEWRKGGLEWD